MAYHQSLISVDLVVVIILWSKKAIDETSLIFLAENNLYLIRSPCCLLPMISYNEDTSLHLVFQCMVVAAGCEKPAACKIITYSTEFLHQRSSKEVQWVFASTHFITKNKTTTESNSVMQEFECMAEIYIVAKCGV